MEKTKKPDDMSFEQWIRRIKYMQTILPKLTDGGERYEIEDLIDSVIAPNLKGTDAVNFVLMGGKTLTSIEGIEDLLDQIEEATEIAAKQKAVAD